jgi:uncharacterized membrane protein
MQTIQFILALVIGWFLAVRDLSLPRIAIGIVAASSVLTLFTLVVQHWTLPPAARSRHGLTMFRGQFSWLFFGTITTIAVTTAVVVLIRQRLG